MTSVLPTPSATAVEPSVESRVLALLAQMTLDEKIGQLLQVQAGGGWVPDDLRAMIRDGRLGSVLNEVDFATVQELQRIAMAESRLGIPLLVGRDVIHGFTTVMPIPLGQAASWNPELVRRGAEVAAHEAAARGVNWTFAPMIDIARDPRWGRIAESLGEDPHLASVLGAAMVQGFQGDDPTVPGRIAACAKHFAGYGASESGRDYNTTNIPEHELRNVYLPPFKAAVDAGVMTLMTSFSDLNGVPASANTLILRDILRDEWQFDGFVVSDWESIRQLQVHGFTASDRDSAREAANAGVDMEMVSRTYADHLAALVHDGEVPMVQIDAMVANILRVKMRLGLFETPHADPATLPAAACDAHLAVAQDAARESLVLLRNEGAILPLSPTALSSIAVIGPLADDPHEQLGTWIFDGDAQYSRTVLQGIRAAVGSEVTVRTARGLETTRSHDHGLFEDAVAAAAASDVVVMVLGEEAILSGEAHCRAEITLPGAQEALIAAVAATGRPIVLVIMAGRPLALERVVSQVHALLYAWHPGTMAGPAIAEVLFGMAAPSGRLPVTLPRVTGQIPIYYAHKPTGKPSTPETLIHIDAIEARAPQTSVGNTSFHLDAGDTPLFPFGFGLSYTTFAYETLTVEPRALTRDDVLSVQVEVVNTGPVAAHEVVQCYVRDRVGSITRPVRELKAFRKVYLAPGERMTVTFVLTPDDLAFHGRDLRRRTEPGHFDLWVGGDSRATLHADFSYVAG